MSSFTFRSREIEIHPYQSGKNWLAEVWLDGECYFPAAPITAAYEMVTRKVIELEGRASFYVVPTAPFVWDDGGRSRSRRSKQINDCTVRAVAIARSLTYDEVYDKLSGLGRECREGFHLHQINPGQWIPFQSIKGFARMYAGPFCKIFGNGRYIIKTAKHVAAVVDGLLHDTSRTDAFRCVYGAWQIRDEDLQNPGQIGKSALQRRQNASNPVGPLISTPTSAGLADSSTSSVHAQLSILGRFCYDPILCISKV